MSPASGQDGPGPGEVGLNMGPCGPLTGLAYTICREPCEGLVPGLAGGCQDTGTELSPMVGQGQRGGGGRWPGEDLSPSCIPNPQGRPT